MATTAKILVWLILQMSDPPVPVPEGLFWHNRSEQS